MEKKKKRWIIAGSITGSLIVIATIILYFLIPSIARNYILKKIDAFEKDRQVTVTMDDFTIDDFSIFGDFDISIKNLHLRDNRTQTEFLFADDIDADIQAWKGFKMTKDLKSLELKNATVNIYKHGDTTNYSFLKKQKKKKKSVGYNERVTKLLELLARACPDEMECKRVELHTDIDSTVNTYLIENLDIEDGTLSGLFTSMPNTPSASRWNISGTMNHKEKVYTGAIALADADIASASIPFGKALDNANIKFRKAKGEMRLLDEKSDQLRLAVNGEIDELEFAHPYLATQPVNIDHTSARLNLTFTKNKIQVDSTSTLCLNQAAIHPYITYEKNKAGKKHIVFKVNERKFDAKTLFASLPEGLFQVVPHVAAKGNIDFHLFLDCDFALLDSLKFDFDIRSRDHSFNITAGREEITRFNEPFEYVFFENGDTARTAWIGPENPYYCPYEQIPYYLTKSITASEDAGFFYHRGFIMSAMQSALISDLKSGRLRRGGSTISQQLIKNLYLSRKKVFSRKIEEMLLVWMIEDYRLLTKERMFEIYVNIAEWGPGIIGIGEASNFYFGKKPADLTFGECLYLATLIRAPKHYRGTVNADGTITENKRLELEATAARMVERGIITEAELQSFSSNVAIKMAAE